MNEKRVGRGRRPKLTRDAVIDALSEAGPVGLSFNELFKKLGKGSKTTLWKILKAIAREGVAERDLEARKYVLSHDFGRKERGIPVPLKLSKRIVELVDLAISKKLATSRSELAEVALVDHLYLLVGEGKLGISEQQLQKKLGAELGLAGHLAKMLMKVDRRLGQLEKQAGLVK